MTQESTPSIEDILARIEESLEKSRKRNRETIEQYPARKAMWEKLKRKLRGE